MSKQRTRIEKVALFSASAAVLLGSAIAASASSTAPAPRTDVKVEAPSDAMMTLTAIGASSSGPHLTTASVPPEHLAAVHPYVETADTAGTTTLRIQSK